MKTIAYVVTDPLGLHARPAGLLVKKTAAYKSRVTLKNVGTGKTADAKRIMGVMSLGVKKDNKIELTVEGEDEDKAAAELETFLKENL